MSVSSDFWTHHEPRGSSALRLAQTFRRSSTTAITLEPSRPEWQQRSTTGPIEPTRRASLTGLSLRLMRSRGKAAFDHVEEEPDQIAHKLGDIFFSMPNEIQVHIVSLVDPRDLLSLRLVSHAFAGLLRINASTISRFVLARSSLADDPLYLQILYPAPARITNLDYVAQLLHRQAVVEKMVLTLVNFIQVKIYQIKTINRRAQFAPHRERMINQFRAPLFIIYHHLETLRSRILSNHEFHNELCDVGDESCHSCERLQQATTNSYPSDQLLPAYQLYKIMISALCRKLRPPTYAGTIERKLRRWDREPPTDKDIAQVVLLGGMREVQRIMSVPKYILRLAALRHFQDCVNAVPPAVKSARKKAQTRTRAMKALDTPDANIIFTVGVKTLPLLSIWIPGARARIVKEGLVESEEKIPSAFTYIGNTIAGRVDSEADDGYEAPVHSIDFAQHANDELNDDDENDLEITTPGDEEMEYNPYAAGPSSSTLPLPPTLF